MSHKLRNIFLFTLFILECRSEDTVDQPDKHVTEAEGRSVTLQCKYKTDSVQEDLFWYIQRANDFPKYILRRSKYGGENGTEFQERFHSELSSNSVPLKIKDLRVSDSAVYYCALRPTVTGNTSDLYKNNERRERSAYYKRCKSQDKVDQHTKIQSAFEGDDVTINCTYQTSYTNPTLFWYQQKVNGIPKYMLNRYSNSGENEDEFEERRFQANLSKTSVSNNTN
ncbi:T cell receptor alpha chain MC.7.G5-like [Megalobrama amblycephala]|uniref:T cell receptor alpha chain MC.7.G5-like n=1 Tax=Megalobrama amblycephala TaxID=75352 RepID=UPI0020144282|nr:T cell receptor alpha chain MC.7.G5-like [Megalobrama amblycephala]